MPSTSLTLAGSKGTAPKPQSMPLRLAENFFRRWILLLLPLLIMGLIGFLLGQRISEDFEASATLSASANPLIEQQEIRGLTTNRRESSSDATARVMNERLETDRFVAGIAERAGLGTAIENDLLGYGAIRRRVSVFPIGESLINVEVSWSDPDTALALIDATIDQYLSVLQSTVAADGLSAVEFFETRRAEAVADAVQAKVEYDEFSSLLPPQLDGVDLPATQQLELERLFNRLVTAEIAIDEADSSIADARLSVVRAQSEIGRSLEIVDPAESTFEPESTLVDRATILLVFLILGGLVALTILVLSTYLDRSVRSAADIEAAGGGTTVAAVPRIKSLRPRRGLRRVYDRQSAEPPVSGIKQAA